MCKVVSTIITGGERVAGVYAEIISNPSTVSWVYYNEDTLYDT